MAKIEIPVLSKEEMEAYIDRKFAEQLEDIKKIMKVTAPPVEPSKPQLPKCKRGPTIKSVIRLSPRMLSVNFDGEDVTRIQVSVQNPEKKNILKDVQSDKTRQSLIVNEGEENVFAPDWHTQILALRESVEDGKTYTITYKATNCTGESSFFFEQIVAPPPKPEPCIPLGRITKIELTQL